jgi:hypothetical protein
MAPPRPACGLDGRCGPVIALCQSLERKMGDIAAANQSCTQDSDCHFVAELTTDPNTQRRCSTYVNTAGLMQLTALADRYAASHCQPPLCADMTPHCTNGSCAAP